MSLREIGETWHFTARTGPAEQVYLALDGPSTPSRWIEMQPTEEEPGVWSVVVTFLPGRHRLRCFTVENGTYLNYGSLGLAGRRLSAADPAVQIDDLYSLAVSA
ncbi:MAG: hypothetical protein AAGI37_16025 [Planctomycetota bacterium]